MKRLALIFAIASLVGCNKPAEEDCKKAIENMRKLMKTSSQITDLRPHIGRCRNSSTKESVECAIKATSRKDLENCGFAHFDETPPKVRGDGSAEGSGAGSGSGQ